MRFRSVPVLDEIRRPQGAQSNIEDAVRDTWRQRFEDARRECERLTKLRAIDAERIEELTRELLDAAPELLAVLTECVDDLEAAHDDGQGARPTAISATIFRALAAIAKAEGR